MMRVVPRSVSRRLQAAQAAFTLIEMLVAMSLAAVIIITLFLSLHVAFKARETAEAKAEPAQTASITCDLLRADLESALPPTGQLAGGFSGTDNTDDRGRDADSITFYAPAVGPLSEPGAAGEIKKVEIGVYTPDGSTQHLLVRRVTGNLLPSQGNTPVPDEEVLCRGVGGFNVQYFDGTQWLDEWDSTQTGNTLPLAVQITLLLDRPTAPGGAQAPAGSTGAGPQSANPPPPGTYRYIRVFRLPCAVVSSDSTTAGSTGLGGGS